MNTVEYCVRARSNMLDSNFSIANRRQRKTSEESKIFLQ